MEKNITKYIVRYKRYYPDSFCNTALEQLKRVDFNKHEFYKASGELVPSMEDDFQVYGGDLPVNSKVMHNTKKIVNNYIHDKFNYPWYNTWNTITYPRYNKYDTNTAMKQHCDHIHTLFDGSRKGVPILTVLTALNDDYEGGAIVFFGDTPYEFEAGDVLVFPSNFMFPHRVDKITKGVRYSFVSWVY